MTCSYDYSRLDRKHKLEVISMRSQLGSPQCLTDRYVLFGVAGAAACRNFLLPEPSLKCLCDALNTLWSQPEQGEEHNSSRQSKAKSPW